MNGPGQPSKIQLLILMEFNSCIGGVALFFESGFNYVYNGHVWEPLLRTSKYNIFMTKK